ncbi:MAG: SsrA-binding protein SmpB [bacterium]|nr:SsrA-binding protein SmpB [bacterium]
MRIFNKKAKFDYNLEKERIETGVVLSGGEAKAIRTGHLDLSQSHARIVNGEVFLINANIPVQGAIKYNSTRMRKLLLHKKEIISLSTKVKQQKLTLVPVKMYTKGHLVKCELALGKSKRKFEKKEAIKRKDIERDIEKEFRGNL